MSFIQVCPQYAKTMQYYGIVEAIALKQDEYIVIPLQEFQHGTTATKNGPGPLQFAGIGEYKIVTTIAILTKEAKQEAADFSFRFEPEDFLDSLNHDFTEHSNETITKCTEIAHVYKPNLAVGLCIMSPRDITIMNLSVIVEYLSGS